MLMQPTRSGPATASNVASRAARKDENGFRPNVNFISGSMAKRSGRNLEQVLHDPRGRNGLLTQHLSIHLKGYPDQEGLIHPELFAGLVF